MKTLFTLIFAFSLTPAFAANVLDCKSGAGYHGNVELARKGDRLILRAAQHFGYEMSANLLLAETAILEVEFETRNCKKLQSNHIECFPPSAKIKAIGFDNRVHTKFDGILDFKAIRSRGATFVEITVSKDHRVATQDLNFLTGPDDEGCRFKL